MHNYFLLHISLITGLGPAVAEKIIAALQAQGVPSDQWDQLTGEDILRYCRLPEKTAQALVEGLQDRGMLDKELALIAKHNVKWLTFLDHKYPVALKHTHLPPLILYYFGADLGPSNSSLAIVGSRKASEYGYRAIQALVPELVKAGCTIVSGGALGIDSMAHRATIAAGGKTVAVIGSGLLAPYPSSNKDLFNAIVRSGGTVISPFPLTMIGLPGNFPARNRIISGLSHGSLIVQAAAKSGALITARYALEQGREVGAVPGGFDDALSAGCHALIKDGALCVTSVADAASLVQLDGFVPEVVQQTLFTPENPVKKVPAPLCHPELVSGSSPIKHPLVALCERPTSFDELLQKSGLEAGDLQTKLFDLQLDGVLEQNFMGLWGESKAY